MDPFRRLALPASYLARQELVRQAGVLVIVSWADVAAEALGERDLVDIVSSLRAETVLRAVSLLSVLITNSPTQGMDVVEPHIALARELCTPEVAARVAQRLQSGRYNVFVHQEQLLAAAVLAIRHGQPGPPGEIGESGVLGRLLLGINDALRMPEKDDAIESLALRRLGLFATDQPRYVLARNYDLLVTRARAYSGSAHPVDLEGAFRVATGGLSIEDYLGFGILYSAAFHDVRTVADYARVQPFSVGAQYEKQINDSVLQITQAAFTADVPQFAAAYARQAATPLALVDYLPFLQRPLARMSDETIVPLSLTVLLRKFADGAYWTLHNQLRATGELTAFTSMLGDLFQDYIGDRLRQWTTGAGSLLRLVTEQEVIAASFHTGKRESRRPPFDFALIDGDMLGLFEVYAGAVPYAIVTSGEVNAFRQSVAKKYVPKGQQLANAIEAISAKQWTIPGLDLAGVRRVLPVLVLLHPFPQFGTMADEIRQPVDMGIRTFGDSPIAATRVYPLQILEAEDVEMLGPLLHHGVLTLQDVLTGRVSAPHTAAASMKTYLLNTLGIEEQSNEEMRHLFETATAAATSALKSQAQIPDA